MFIRYMSDIHLEFGWMNIMSLEEDKDSVLVLAGDIGVVHQPSLFDALGRFLFEASTQFLAVVYVLGNHEFYHDKLDTARAKIRDRIAKLGLENVYVLENEGVVINDSVAFIGATLWTDYDNNPVNMVLGSQALNDFRLIWVEDVDAPRHGNDSIGERPITPEDLVKRHNYSRHYIFDEVGKQKASGNKTVVVVHHGVSYNSVHPRYRGDPYNSSFVSEMTNDIMAVEPDVVIHGHVHDAFDYYIGKTRVLVNPRGYVSHETSLHNGFDPVARIEL